MKGLLQRVGVMTVLALASWVASASEIAGQWRGTLDGEALVLDLRADGGGTLDGAPIRWQQLGNQLMVEMEGEVMAYTVQQRGDQMTVSGGDLVGSLTLGRGGKTAAVERSAQKSRAPAAAREGIDPSMVGQWCYVASFSANAGGGSQSSRCFELRADGTYTFQSESSMSAYAPGMWGGTTSSDADSGRWSVSGGSIVAQSNSGSVNRYPLEKRNHPKNRDPMLCLDGDCYVTQYQKAPW
jgi:hypothetical protein